MAMSLQPHYFPAVCRKCGDVTQCLRSPLMRALKVGQCGRRELNGAPCRGDCYFTEQKIIIPTKRKAEPIVVTENALGDLLDKKERPYDLNREMDALQEALGDQESWGTSDSAGAIEDPVNES